MEKLIELMETRRSVRKFRSDPVPDDMVEKIVRCGTYAPSGMNRQPQVIIAVTNKEMRDKLAESNRRIGGWKEGFDPFYGAPAVLIVLADKSVPTCVYDGSLTMQNLMLAAHELGLGSCWIHRAKEEFAMPEWQEWLKSIGVSGEYEGIGHCILGYTDGEYPQAPERRENRTYFIK